MSKIEHTAGECVVENSSRPEIFTVNGQGGYFNAGHLASLAKYDSNLADAELMARFREVPHDCTDPACPGNLNREKLELLEEALRVCQAVSNDCYMSAKEYVTNALDRARELGVIE